MTHQTNIKQLFKKLLTTKTFQTCHKSTHSKSQL